MEFCQGKKKQFVRGDYFGSNNNNNNNNNNSNNKDINKQTNKP